LLKDTEKTYGVSSDDTTRKINALNEVKKIRGGDANSENEEESSDSEEGDSSENGDIESIEFSSESIYFICTLRWYD
jgi:hypothetical protein